VNWKWWRKEKIRKRLFSEDDLTIRAKKHAVAMRMMILCGLVNSCGQEVPEASVEEGQSHVWPCPYMKK